MKNTNTLIRAEVEINLNQKIDDPRMDDSGAFYFGTFEYRLAGDKESYGEDEWRLGKITYDTTADWDKAQCNMDDESYACDWDVYTVMDEDSAEMPCEIVAIIATMI